MAEGKKSRKVGRSKRKPASNEQSRRTYTNKLNRINRDRKKSGKPPLGALPMDTSTSQHYFGSKK